MFVHRVIHVPLTDTSSTSYTGEILQWLDTNVHSAVAAKMSTAL